ncbi:MAG: acetate--CoA ligase [Bacteroidetes bacterium]|nr:acetate--CoA ligase [Bacteroidota bacterium]
MKFEINSYQDYQKEYQKSVINPEGFWAEKANEFIWRKKWNNVLSWNFTEPTIKWFEGGKLNITENCLDRHLQERGNKIAYIWEPNNPNEKNIKITYFELYTKVCRFANVLKNNGIKKGDRVCMYMPMIPELVVSMLACARIGAIHSVVYAGFSSDALANRIQDTQSKLLITSNGAYRGTKQIKIKTIVDEALKKCESIKKVIVVKRTDENISMLTGRDVLWKDEEANVGDTCNAVEMDAEDILFVLYTSGSTGKPKGIVHTCAGYMVYVDYTFRNIFHCSQQDVYWCSADIGWITGHSYLVYGPLLSGVTSVMFEGIPTYPDAGRYWEVIDKHNVNIFYTSPTAIRALMTYDIDFVDKHQLTSLKLLGTVGEPINESAWKWYYKHIGKEKCFIVDTWWQTETGGIAISPLLNVSYPKPGYAMHPLPGIQPTIVDGTGKKLIGNEVQGQLCIKFPWPGMLRTIYNNPERYKQTYFTDFPGFYFTGDGCKRDKNGDYRITGRVDDLIKISGHLLGTAEIENAINSHHKVVESAVIGYPHPIKGNAICAFVVPFKTSENPEQLKLEIIEQVSHLIGPIAKPDKVQLITELPKTRSGKIMRRILQKILGGETTHFGDTSTLINPKVIETLVKENIKEFQLNNNQH